MAVKKNKNKFEIPPIYTNSTFANGGALITNPKSNYFPNGGTIMDNIEKYTYQYRPAYGTNNLLIEFTNGADNEDFIKDLFDTIEELNPQITGQQDLWMNDEVVFSINSDLGQVSLSKDIWGFAFLMSDDYQSCLLKINDILIRDTRFKKIEVEFDDYK